MKITKYIYGLTLIFCMSSCSFLDVEPTDFISPSNYFKTEKEADRVLNGVYHSLASQAMFGRNLVVEFDLFCNDLALQGSTSSVGVPFYEVTPGDKVLSAVWAQLYDGINRANIFLENIDNVSMNEDKKRDWIAQARFIRALCYFYLVQNWGDVPLKLTADKNPNDLHVATSSSAKIFKAIIDDLEYGVEELSEASDIASAQRSSRVSKSAARALLARVYLRRAGWPFNVSSSYQKAVKYARDIVDSKEHDLNLIYKDVFMNLIEDKYDRLYNEIIMEIDFYGNGKGDNFTAFGNFNSYTVMFTIGGTQVTWGNTTYCTDKYFKMFGPSDSRRDWNICPYTFSGNKLENGHVAIAENNSKRSLGKFYREFEIYKPIVTTACPTNFPLIRYAEVLLILAEADVMENNAVSDEAIEAINKLRRRAGADELDKDEDPSILDIGNFMMIIKNERAMELFFEGFRRQDLIRWNELVTTMRAMGADANYISANPTVIKRVDKKYMILPYPEKELSTNNLMRGKQNVGW